MSKASVVVVGDVSFGDNLVCASFGVDSMLGRNPDMSPFEHVMPTLKEADIVFGNLETVLSDHGQEEGQLSSNHMRGREAYVRHLVDAGFSVMSMANNHILQHGRKAYLDTVSLLEAHNITVAGQAEANGLNCKPASITQAGREIVFLGYGFEDDKYYDGTTLYAHGSEKHVLEDIRAHKTANNLLVCSFHWGNEFILYPSLEQIRLGRAAIDAGCDMIVGHHPHVINGYEAYNGGIILYSLGNFVCDQLWNARCMRSMIVKLTVGDEFCVESCLPVQINRQYQPTIIDDPNFEQELRKLSEQIHRDSTNGDRDYEVEFS